MFIVARRQKYLVGPVVLPASDTAHTLADLRPGLEYTIIVEAYYQDSVGPQSMVTMTTTLHSNITAGGYNCTMHQLVSLELRACSAVLSVNSTFLSTYQ